MKKALSLLLALVISLSCMAVVFADAANISETPCVYIGNENTENEKSLEAISWWISDNGKCFFFIPSNWNTSALKLMFTGADKLLINGKEIENGTVSALEKTGKITFAGKEYPYTIMSSGKVGSVFIQTESGSLDAVHANKETKEAGKVAIFNSKGENQCENDKLDYIKGRGNQTWEYDKRPYNIKLNKKVKLLGMAKSKKWCLIANYDDLTLSRNAIMYGAAADADMPYSPEYAPVDLYINNEYKGSYLLTSKIEADEKRIDVESLDDVNEEVCIDKFGEDFDMDTLARGGVYGKYSGLLENTYKYVDIPSDSHEGGYVLEMELANRYAAEISGFVTSRSQPVIMKSPEYASKAQMEFISKYYQDFEDAVFSKDDKNSNGKYYYDLADMTSLVKYYLISEWASNMDSGLTSTYFYLDTNKDGKLYAGPVWDYDIALGNNGGKRFGCNYNNPEEFTVAFSRMYRNTIFGSIDAENKPTIYNTLTNKESFVAECKKEWDSTMYEAVNTWAGEKAGKYISDIKASAVMNHILWNTFGTDDIATVSAKYDEAVNGLKSFMTARTSFLNSNIDKVQQQNVKDNIVVSLGKAILSSLNSIIEKFIVIFHLENK